MNYVYCATKFALKQVYDFIRMKELLLNTIKFGGGGMKRVSKILKVFFIRSKIIIIIITIDTTLREGARHGETNSLQ